MIYGESYLNQSSFSRVLSGMRPTGALHLGHYHGALKNWVRLQHEHECFFCVVDLHALTTHYDEPQSFETNVWEMVVDWLAAGINPGSANIFIQSQVAEHAELHLLLSMITPLGWLERVPTYKEQQEKLKEKDLSTYGFLGYPLLQSADIMLYKATYVPVGEDQVPHIELTREIARRFNHIYGRDTDYEQKAQEAILKLGKKNAKLYRTLLQRYQQEGDHEALATGQALVEEQNHISISDRERLHGYLEGGGKIILPEPQPLLTQNPKLPGLDGQKMSKSYHNTIALRDTPEVVEQKVKTMQTDPARVRLTDPGDPEKCPVWGLHKVYSKQETLDWVSQGCRSAGIGCLECKKPLIQSIQEELVPIRDRAQEYLDNPSLVKAVVAEGCERAKEVARDTMVDVRDAIGIDYT
ncbi:MAG: tryptophan--tRNA ligase [Legionellales bacterium]|nr:tryptophan--tRNA ligase [Legionellales bacterium]